MSSKRNFLKMCGNIPVFVYIYRILRFPPLCDGWLFTPLSIVAIWDNSKHFWFFAFFDFLRARTALIVPHLLLVQFVHFHRLPVCLSTSSVRGCEAEQCESRPWWKSWWAFVLLILKDWHQSSWCFIKLQVIAELEMIQCEVTSSAFGVRHTHPQSKVHHQKQKLFLMTDFKRFRVDFFPQNY